MYARRDSASAYHDFQFPHRVGIHRRGEFPAAVVWKAYSERGYDCWISAQSRHGVQSYLLERLPRIRRNGDRAYLKMIEVFGREAVERVHALAAVERRAHLLRSAGGDPDLFVQHRATPEDRFFIEVTLENLTRRPPYRDTLTRQQLILFPIIEKELQCDVKVATVSIHNFTG